MTLNDNNQNQMNSINNTDIIDKLNIYYNIYSNEIPEQRIKSEFHTANYHGFFKGIIEYGDEMFKNELDQLLNNELQSQSENADNNENLKDPKMPSKDINAFFEKMFALYIYPFKQHTGRSNGALSVSNDSSLNNSSKNNSAANSETDSNGKKQNQNIFRNNLMKRDGVCLFCWENTERKLQAAHIHSKKKNVTNFYGMPSLLESTGLGDINDVQNGLLICSGCHIEFDALKRYVDFVDGKFVLKIVNETNDPNNVKHLVWLDVIERTIISRKSELKLRMNLVCKDDRLAVESNGEMGLYFMINDEDKLPNKKALEFHKAACLIWRMAGGAESDDEYCSDDEELGQVNTAELKERYNWKNSDETMNMPLLSE